MKLSIKEYKKLIALKENEALELKEAKANFSKRDFADYSAAIANERGGKLILGVDDDGELVSTSVFENTENKLPHEIYQSTGLKTQATSYEVSGKRILVIDIPSRPIGRPVQSNGRYRYPMRLGESLTEMDTETLGKIFQEISPDNSAGIVSQLTFKELNKSYIESFKKLWAKKASNNVYLSKTDTEILTALNLKQGDGIALAALILFGENEALTKHLPDSEIVFEWRAKPQQTNFDYRQTWRIGFIGIYDEIWQALDARNTRHSFQEGFVQREIKAFDEKPFREALLNAVAHRDYTLKGQSIFIKANPEYYTIESPGALIGGVTLKNIFDKTAWRNRLLAETLEKAGLVERSGQGIDDIFEITIRNGKGTPKMEEPFSSSFKITIPAKIEDLKFIQYLESVSREKNLALNLEEILELEHIRKEGPVSKVKFSDKFSDNGIIDKLGTGRGRKYILSHKYYISTKAKGLYTRLTGLSREAKKQLIIKHIKENGKAERVELKDAFPDLTPQDVSNLLQELRSEKSIVFSGPRRTGHWELSNK